MKKLSPLNATWHVIIYAKHWYDSKKNGRDDFEFLSKMLAKIHLLSDVSYEGVYVFVHNVMLEHCPPHIVRTYYFLNTYGKSDAERLKEALVTICCHVADFCDESIEEIPALLLDI